MSDNIFTLKEVVAILKVPENTIKALLSTNELNHFKIRGKVRVSETHINTYLASVEVSKKNQMMAN